MKQCFKCLESKPIEAFYKHSRMADGHLGKCKECAKADNNKWRLDTLVERSAYEQSRTRTTIRRAKRIMYTKAYRLRNPEKARARNVTAQAVKSGLLVRTPCVHCGAVKVQVHHRDYSKPLDVVWVCFKCHREIEHGQHVVVEAF